MASHDDNDDTINFDKLEKELLTAVEADNRYWTENDAKIRAVQNKVASYEEFKDIVLASHLKPLERGDKIATHFIQPWNNVANKTANLQLSETNELECNIEQDNAKIPKNSQEFVQVWRRLYKTDEKRRDFLLHIGPDELGKIFKTEISFGLLGDFVQALLLLSNEEQSKTAVLILDTLSRVNRFSLSVQFMSKKEKENCEKLFDHLAEKVNEKPSQDQEDELLEKISNLRTVYGTGKKTSDRL